MIKALVTIIVIAGLVVGGYFLFRNDAHAPANPFGEETVVEETPDTGKKMAFSEFVKQKGNYECTVNVNVNEVITQGKIYIAGEKMRGEYKTDINGQVVDATFVSDGAYAYSWSSVAPIGIKVRITPDAANEDTHTLDYDMIGDYDCKDWNPESSKFVVPANITFSAVN